MNDIDDNSESKNLDRVIVDFESGINEELQEYSGT